MPTSLKSKAVQAFHEVKKSGLVTPDRLLEKMASHLPEIPFAKRVCLQYLQKKGVIGGRKSTGDQTDGEKAILRKLIGDGKAADDLISRLKRILL
jgi:hypothetical protein